MDTPKYKRVLVKLSGEALMAGGNEIIDKEFLKTICTTIKKCTDMGTQVAIVVGAGNIWRGRQGEGMDRTRADHMGMLATVINCLAIQDMLENIGAPARVMTAVEMKAFAKASELPWYNVRTSAVKLEITGVAKISNYAFYGMYYIKEISFGGSVTDIGNCAFAFCSSLEELTLPETVKSIGVSAFEGCAALKSIKLPASIESIGERAFAYNHALTSLSIDQSFLTALPQAEFDAIFMGIAQPTITTTGTPESAPEESPAESESTSTDESADATDSTEKSEAETDKSTETEAPAPEKQNDVTTIIAIVVLALVIVGLVVGGILLARSNKNQAKDSRTVRKSSDSNYNKNSNSKGKKK